MRLSKSPGWSQDSYCFKTMDSTEKVASLIPKIEGFKGPKLSPPNCTRLLPACDNDDLFNFSSLEGIFRVLVKWVSKQHFDVLVLQNISVVIIASQLH